jgi:transposase
LVWSILGAVERMDLTAFYGAYRENGQGRAAYEPSMMALFVYVYARGDRSSRGIERGCREDVVYKLITAMRVPDHSTIAEFRRRHERPIAELFSSVLELCEEAGLVEVGVISIDGTKIRANASRVARTAPTRSWSPTSSRRPRRPIAGRTVCSGPIGAISRLSICAPRKAAAKRSRLRRSGSLRRPAAARSRRSPGSSSTQSSQRPGRVDVRGIARDAKSFSVNASRPRNRSCGRGRSGCLRACPALSRTTGSRFRPTPPMRQGGQHGPLVACPARNSGCHRSRSRPRRPRRV